MEHTTRLSLDAARSLAEAALTANRTSEANAAATARALIAAARDGQKGHGFSRIPSYAAQASSGKVNGYAEPTVERVSAAALRIDGGLGFAYPAIDRAIAELPALAAETGIAAAAIHRSHHFGQAGAHVERLAERGLVALIFGNSPKAIAFWGGRKPMMGTNPVAFAAPLMGSPPLVIDLALSVAARGRIKAAEQTGEAIPEGWAMDAEGNPTTDPAAALAGSMVPVGGAKGAALVLMIEILSAALTGSHFGFEATSFFDGAGDAPNVGQVLIAIDPDRVSAGAFAERLAVLVEAMQAEPGVRLPGTSRLESRRRADAEGLVVPTMLYETIVALAETSERRRGSIG